MLQMLSIALTVLTVLASSLLPSTVFADCETVNCQPRVPWEGRRIFSAGQAAVGDVIELDDGRRDTNCYILNAPISGVFQNGVRNPWQSEIDGRRACDFSGSGTSPQPAPGSNPSQPAPRASCDTVNCKPRFGDPGHYTFHVGEAVVAGYVHLDSGAVDHDCYLANATITGDYEGGVVNPWPTELKKPCTFSGSSTGSSPAPAPGGSPQPTPGPAQGSCDTVNCKPRFAEAGHFTFHAGEAVVAGYVHLDDGRTDHDCYLDKAPINGDYEGGVVNPWPSELKKACTFQTTSSTPAPSNPAPQPTPAPSNPAPQPTPSPTAVPAGHHQLNPQCDTVDCKANKNTARDGNPLSFSQHDAIWAGRIVFDDGKEVGNCYLFDARTSGKLYDGSLHPYVAELKNAGIDPTLNATCNV